MCSGRVASVAPTSRPLSSASTSVLRLPFHQSRATRPVSPGADAPPARSARRARCTPRHGFVLDIGRRRMLHEPGEAVAHGRLARLVARTGRRRCRPRRRRRRPAPAARVRQAARWHVDVPRISISDPASSRRCRAHRHARRSVRHATATSVPSPRRSAHAGVSVPTRVPGATTDCPPPLPRRSRSKPGVQCLQVRVRRVALVLVPQALVAGGTGIAGNVPVSCQTTQSPPSTIRSARREDLGRLLEHLECLGQHPLRRDASAVPCQPGLAALRRHLGDASRLRLRRVVLPQLRPRVWLSGEPRIVHQRDANRRDGQHRADVKSMPSPTMSAAATPARRERLAHARLQRLEPVARVLQRPLGAERDAGRRQLLVDDAVPV